MGSIVSVKHFTANIGPTVATGVLFVADPSEDSFAQGTVSLLGLVQASFMLRLDGKPITINVSVSGIRLTLVFDLAARALVGRIDEPDPTEQSEASPGWQPIIRLN